MPASIDDPAAAPPPPPQPVEGRATAGDTRDAGDMAGDRCPRVRELRQILLWPLQLLPDLQAGHARPWERLAGGPWQEVVDEVVGGQRLTERHYSEFVAFLPYVQSFLYGDPREWEEDAAARDGAEGTTADAPRARLREARAATRAARQASPMRVFRRHDIPRARAVLHPGATPIDVEVTHIDLYFFYDLDLVLLNVELRATDLSLGDAQELMYRCGRGYPAGWDETGQPQHCMHEFAWLDAAGNELVRSDARDRDAFLRHVSQHRAPRIAGHWQYVLAPLVPAVDVPPSSRALRYRQIDYYRMPMMASLAVDDPTRLTRADFLRLAFVTGSSGGPQDSPLTEDAIADFEHRYCYDRFWSAGGAAPHTRYLAVGHALVVVGDARRPFFVDAERGVLAQFRHQHFLLFLIAHVQKAALLMYSNGLVRALRDLDVRDADSVKGFKRAIRRSFEGFLRFTHRYWFHEISEQAHVRALFRMTSGHLELDTLYAEVRERIEEMNDYLESDSLRRQANTVVRLTVVTIFGLVGTLATGFLGMNLLAEAEAPWWRRVLLFVVVTVVFTALVLLTIARSKRLSDLLDALSDDRLSARQKMGAIWGALR